MILSTWRSASLPAALHWFQRGEASLARQWIAEADAIGKDSAIGYVTNFFVPFWTGMLQVTQGEDEAGYAKLSCAWEYFEGGGGFLLGPLASMMKATAAMNLGRFNNGRADCSMKR